MLQSKLLWIKKNWLHLEISNQSKGGYVIITIYTDDSRTSGAMFTETQIDQSIQYIINKKQTTQLTLF